MKSTSIAIVTGALICMFSASIMSQSSKDWVDIKDPKELRTLFSNKTFHGHLGWTGHYRADGKSMFIVGSTGKRDARTWEIKGNDQVCVTQGDGVVNCNRFQRHRTKPNELTMTNVKDGRTFYFTVEDGIPKF